MISKEYPTLGVAYFLYPNFGEGWLSRKIQEFCDPKFSKHVRNFFDP